jgi:hypothetical protein
MIINDDSYWPDSISDYETNAAMHNLWVQVRWYQYKNEVLRIENTRLIRHIHFYRGLVLMLTVILIGLGLRIFYE